MLFLGHPLIVHFPIALWLASLAFDIAFWWRKDPFFARAGRALMGLGAASAAVAIATGFWDLARLAALGVGGAAIDIHRIHSVFSYAATGFYTVYFVSRWRRPEPSRWWHALLAAAGAALIAATGWYGGELRAVM